MCCLSEGARFCEFWFRGVSSSKRHSRSHNWSKKIKWLHFYKELDKLSDNKHYFIQPSIWKIEKGKQTRAQIFILSSIVVYWKKHTRVFYSFKQRLLLYWFLLYFYNGIPITFSVVYLDILLRTNTYLVNVFCYKAIKTILNNLYTFD